MKTLGKIALVALAASSLTVPAAARRGADDPVGHVRQEDRAPRAATSTTREVQSNDVRQCRGCDDPVGHVRQEDRAPRATTSSAREVQSNDVRRSRGADDAPGHVRGGGADDPRPHN